MFYSFVQPLFSDRGPNTETVRAIPCRPEGVFARPSHAMASSWKVLHANAFPSTLQV